MKVLVCVTTTKARLDVFFYALQSLKRQTYEDYYISVYLSQEPFLLDEGIRVVPDWMRGERLQVGFVSNSGSYRKLLPAIVDAADEDLIVTADDDVLYARNWLERIVKAAELHPTHIVCGRARSIQKNILGRFQNYSNWPIVSKSMTGRALLPIGCSGIAYRRNLLDLDFMLDQAFRDCAPTSDDIWFRLASLRKHVEVYVDPEIESENAYTEPFVCLSKLNQHVPDLEPSLLRRLIVRAIRRTRDYLGIPVSRNDLAWTKSLQLLESRGQPINL